MLISKTKPLCGLDWLHRGCFVIHQKYFRLEQRRCFP
nr:MAG TPA: hypothetical protein [Caudoviricetes sp.]